MLVTLSKILVTFLEVYKDILAIAITIEDHYA